MDMLSQQKSTAEKDLQKTRGKIPLEIKEYVFRTCGDAIFNRLFERYKEETGKNPNEKGKTDPEAYRWVVKNLSTRDFKMIIILAEDEINYGLEKERQYNLHPDFRDALLQRLLDEELERQILEG